MKKVIQFTRARFIAIAISIVILAAGITLTVMKGGFDMGIDFEAGLNLRVQVASPVFTVFYTGEGECTFNVTGNNVSVEIVRSGQPRQTYAIPFSRFGTVEGIIDRLNAIPGFTALPESGFETVLATIDSERVAGLNQPEILDENPVYVNVIPGSEAEIFAPIGEMRAALSGVAVDQIQLVGSPVTQNYILKVEDDGSDREFSSTMSGNIVRALTTYFGAGSVVVRQSDYIGPRFSQDLGTQSAYLISFALGLILVYIWIRFRLAYAVSAIIALVHDVGILAIFVGVTGMEVSVATIAAGLTIIGYSLNDTIVIFDRVRENIGLMRDSDFKTIINTSISQSLSRTLMTSITTLLAVSAIYIFGTGIIKDFALALIVGIIVGTYSSLFIASPILLGWTNRIIARKKQKDAEKFGRKPEMGREQIEEPSEEPQAANPEKKAEAEPKIVPKAPVKPRYTDKKKRKKKKKKR
jgi:preprotein translocase subunit SecF